MAEIEELENFPFLNVNKKNDFKKPSVQVTNFCRVMLKYNFTLPIQRRTKKNIFTYSAVI